jgi:hypothetical protein
VARCFNEQFRPELMDRQSFKFGHNLLDHPALTLASLSEVIPALPQSQVMYSKQLLETGADFEGTFKKRPQDASIEEVIDQIPPVIPTSWCASQKSTAPSPTCIGR